MEQTTSPKRSRGRPIGTGKDDGPSLQMVAQLLAQNPGMRPVTAMKQIVGPDKESDIHRLNRKWREAGDQYLALARQEIFWRNCETALNNLRTFAVEAHRIARQFEPTLRAILSNPQIRAHLETARVLANSPLVKVLAQARVNQDVRYLMHRPRSF